MIGNPYGCLPSRLTSSIQPIEFAVGGPLHVFDADRRAGDRTALQVEDPSLHGYRPLLRGRRHWLG